MRMAKFFLDISMSLDGFVAGPDPTLEEPLGKDGERLHEWVLRLASWRSQHGLEEGETGPDDEVSRETSARVGAVVMGRKMFSGGDGPWESDPNPDAWWGDNPPFHVPVFVLTHHEREQVVKEGGTTFTFVTNGVERRPATGTSCSAAARRSRSSTCRPGSSTSSTSTSRRCSSAGASASSASSAPMRLD